MGGEWTFGGNFKRKEFDKIIWGNHDTTGMYTVRTDGTLEFGSIINYAFGGWVVFIFIFEVWGIDDSISEFDVVSLNWVRNKFGNTISLGIRHFEHASHITYGVFSHHLTKGNNVGDTRLAIFISTVLNHLVAASILDVGIDIWHRNTVWV